mgnify:CR=1 FL=1
METIKFWGPNMFIFLMYKVNVVIVLFNTVCLVAPDVLVTHHDSLLGYFLENDVLH